MALIARLLVLCLLLARSCAQQPVILGVSFAWPGTQEKTEEHIKPPLDMAMHHTPQVLAPQFRVALSVVSD